MKTTIALLLLLSSTAFAEGFVAENSICSTDSKLVTKCGKPNIAKITTPESSVLKYRENGVISYSDTAPSNSNYQKLELSTLKDKVTYYHTDKKELEKLKLENAKFAEKRQQEEKAQYLRASLHNARTALYNLKPNSEDDWTYLGRTRVLSPAYTEKELFLKREIVKLEIMLEQL